MWFFDKFYFCLAKKLQSRKYRELLIATLEKRLIIVRIKLSEHMISNATDLIAYPYKYNHFHHFDILAGLCNTSSSNNGVQTILLSENCSMRLSFRAFPGFRDWKRRVLSAKRTLSRLDFSCHRTTKIMDIVKNWFLCNYFYLHRICVSTLRVEISFDAMNNISLRKYSSIIAKIRKCFQRTKLISSNYVLNAILFCGKCMYPFIRFYATCASCSPMLVSCI